MIDAQALESRLAWVRSAAAGPTEGIFGPQSVTWRVDREAALFLGAGRALLLQLAHPWVAAAIGEHSTTLADPIGRFHRTFDVMFTLVFGTLDQAMTASRRLHRRHAQITGRLPDVAGPYGAHSQYFANEASALFWVHATLVETALVAHDLALPALTPADRERYYAESKTLAALFAIPNETIPQDWAAFDAYNRSMWQSDRLTVTPATRDFARKLMDGPRRLLRWPEWYRAVTASLLPPRIAEQFGLRSGPEESRRAETAIRRIRRLYSRLPERIRFVGPYQEAVERIAGRSRPRPAVRTLNRLWIGKPQL